MERVERNSLVAEKLSNTPPMIVLGFLTRFSGPRRFQASFILVLPLCCTCADPLPSLIVRDGAWVHRYNLLHIHISEEVYFTHAPKGRNVPSR